MFAAIFTILCTHYMQPYTVHAREYVERILVGDGLYSTGITLKEVSSATQFYEFMSDTFYKSLFHAQLEVLEDPEANNPPVDSLLSLRLVGDVLVWSNRVKMDKGCLITEPFSKIFGHCYSSESFSASFQDTSAYGSGGTFQSSDLSLPFVPVRSYTNAFGYDLNKGGFIQIVSKHANEASATLANLKSSGFVDPDITRVVVVFVNLFSTSTKSYIMAQVRFEVTSSGSWIGSIHTESLPYWMTAPFDNSVFTALTAITAVLLVYFAVIEVLQLFVASNKLECLRSGFVMYCIILLTLAQLAVMASMAAPNMVAVGQSGSVFNGWTIIRLRRALVVLMSVDLILVYSRSILNVVASKTRLYILFTLFLVYLSMAMHIVLYQSGGFNFFTLENSIYFVVLSALGISDWSISDNGGMGSFIVFLSFIGFHFGIFCYIASVKVHRVVDGDSPVSRLYKYVEYFRVSLSRKFEFWSQKWYSENAIDIKIKRLFPGWYHRVTKPDQVFRLKVKEIEMKDAKALSPSDRSQISSARTEEAGSKISARDRNLKTVIQAVAELKHCLSRVSSDITKETEALTRRMGELSQIVTALGSKIS